MAGFEGGLTTAAVVSCAVYLGALLVIGAAAARFSSRGLAEYFVGGRRLGRWVVALSAVASGRSSWVVLGLTGLAYLRGASAVWAVVGYTLAELLLFLFYAPRLRRFAEVHDCITLPDFFAARLGDPRGTLRTLLAAIMTVFLTAYVAAQLTAGGKAVAAGLGGSFATGVLVTAGIVLAYTVLGGFVAASLTDVLQAVVMAFALVALPVVAIAARGGFGPLLEELRTLDATLLDPVSLSLGAAIGFVGIGLGSPGSPHVIVRYLSIRDPADLRAAAVIGTTWNVILGWGAIFTGLAARAWYPDLALLPGQDPESAYPLLAREHLPPVLFGIVIAALFAAIMSTADSQLLVASSSLVSDCWVKVLRRGRELPPRVLVTVSRLVVVALVAVSVGLAFAAQRVPWLSDLVFWLVLLAWAGLGASIGPTSILALFWKGTTRQGVVAGLVTGTLVTLLWAVVPALDALVYELVPGFAAGFLATVVGSKLTLPPDDASASMDVMAGRAAGR